MHLLAQGAIASGVVLLSIGVPCIAMGIYYRKTANEVKQKIAKTEDKKKGKKSKNSKRNEKKKDQPGKERGTSGGVSLIVGGLAFSLFGLGLILKSVMGQ